MIRFFTALILISVQLLYMSSSKAQSAMRYTLDQAIEIALENNRLLAAQRFSLEASDWNVKKAYSGYLPQVNINQRLTRVDNISVRNANFAIEGLKSFPGFEDVDIPPLLFKDTYATLFSVNQPLYTGGQLSTNLEMAKISEESERLTLKDNEAETILNMKRAYFDYARNLEFIHVQSQSLELAQRNLSNARAKNELGLRPRSDILRWEAEVASEESSLVEMENAAAAAGMNMANIMGIDLDEDFDIDLPSDEEFRRWRENLEIFSAGERNELLQRLYETARSNNPGRGNIELQRSLSESAVGLARSGFLPQISFAYQYAWQPNDTPALDGFKSWDASVNFSYSLFNGFGDYSEVRRAQADLKQVEYREQDFDRSLRVSIFTAFNNIRTALARITLAEKNLLQAEDNMSLVRSRYDLGIASNIDLIDAQVLEASSRVNLVSARYDLLLDGAELERLTGKQLSDY
ncbi:TolC family protein [candidate division KSB1 bacterium]